MLPVQVRVVSSSTCTLSQASALLERFLSSDASFATDYVAIVAQALQDSISRRAEHHFPASSESPSRSSKQLVDVKQSTLVAGNPPHSKLHSHGKKNLLAANTLFPTSLGDVHTDEKQSLSAADADVAMEVPEAEKRHKKKRRHSAVENGLETVPPAASEMEDSALMNHNQKLHDRKRRKKEKQGRYTEDMETFHATENRGSPVSLSVDENLDKKSAYKAKKKVEVCNKDANNAGVSITPLSSKVEEQAGSSKRKRKRKEDKALILATPVKVPCLEKIKKKQL